MLRGVFKPAVLRLLKQADDLFRSAAAQKGIADARRTVKKGRIKHNAAFAAGKAETARTLFSPQNADRPRSGVFYKLFAAKAPSRGKQKIDHRRIAATESISSCGSVRRSEIKSPFDIPLYHAFQLSRPRETGKADQTYPGSPAAPPAHE